MLQSSTTQYFAQAVLTRSFISKEKQTCPGGRTPTWPRHRLETNTKRTLASFPGPFLSSPRPLTSPTMSTSPQTPAIHPHPYGSSPHPEAPPQTDPKVADLQVMFPTVDPSVILLILESSHGSSDRAIELLLQMTDPEFKPDELHAVRHEEEVCPLQSTRYPG